MTDWQRDLDDELWAGDGRDPEREADAARPFDWDGPADGSGLETWLCRECGAVFAIDEGMDPSFCPFCGAGEEP